MENPIKMDDFGGTTIFGNTRIEQGSLLLMEEILHRWTGWYGKKHVNTQ